MKTILRRMILPLLLLVQCTLAEKPLSPMQQKMQNVKVWINSLVGKSEQEIRDQHFKGMTPEELTWKSKYKEHLKLEYRFKGCSIRLSFRDDHVMLATISYISN